MTTVTRPGFQAAGEVDADGAQARLQAAQCRSSMTSSKRHLRGDRRERQALLAERHAAAAQHARAVPGRGSPRLGGQPGLADPCFPGDQNPAPAVRGVWQI